MYTLSVAAYIELHARSRLFWINLEKFIVPPARSTLFSFCTKKRELCTFPLALKCQGADLASVSMRITATISHYKEADYIGLVATSGWTMETFLETAFDASLVPHPHFHFFRSVFLVFNFSNVSIHIASVCFTLLGFWYQWLQISVTVDKQRSFEWETAAPCKLIEVLFDLRIQRQYEPKAIGASTVLLNNPLRRIFSLHIPIKTPAADSWFTVAISFSFREVYMLNLAKLSLKRRHGWR